MTGWIAERSSVASLLIVIMQPLDYYITKLLVRLIITALMVSNVIKADVSITRLPSNLIRLTLTASPQTPVTLLETSDLVNWTTNSLTSVPTSGMLSIELPTSGQLKFFRVDGGNTGPIGVVVAKASGFGAADIVWTRDALGWAGISIYRMDLSKPENVPELIGDSDSEALEFTDENVPLGTFKYLVSAFSVIGNEELNSASIPSNPIQVDGLPTLGVANSVSATNSAFGEVRVIWNYEGPSVDGFKIYRGQVDPTVSEPDDALTVFDEIGITDSIDRVFIDEDLVAGRYFYAVATFRGEDDAEEEGEYAISSWLTVNGMSPIFPPWEVRAQAVGFGTVEIKWEDTNSGRTAYNVYRLRVLRVEEPLLEEGDDEESEDISSLWDEVVNVGETDRGKKEFIDRMVPRGNYQYLVAPVLTEGDESVEGEHEFSNAVMVNGRPVLTPPNGVIATNFGFGRVRITWEDSAEDEEGFRVYRVSLDFSSNDYIEDEDEDEDVALELFEAGVVGSNQTVFEDANVPEGSYRYLVTAFRSVEDEEEESDFGESEDLAVMGLPRPARPVVLLSGLGTDDLMPLHRWQSLPGADRIELEVAVLREDGYATIEERRIVLAGNATSYKTSRAYTRPPRTLRWRIRGHNRAGAGQWSEWADLFLVVAPTTRDCGISSPNLSPTHRWDPIPDARLIEFEVQVLRNGVWDTVESRRRVDIPGSSTEYREPPYTNPPRSLRWRVRGVYVHGSSPWSDWCGYDLLIDVPAKPILLGCGQTTDDLTPLHRWEPVARAESIEFEVAVLRHEGWVSIEERRTNLLGSAVSFQTSRAYTSPPRVLRWRIRGLNTTGRGDWSDWCDLNLVLQPPVTLDCGRTSTSMTPTYRWQQIKDANLVEFEVQVLSQGVWLTIDSRSRADISGAATSYTESVAYTRPPRSLRWRVRGRFSWGNGPWSNWCGLELALQPPVTSDCGKTSSDATPTHRWQRIPEASFVEFEVQVLSQGVWSTIESRSRTDISGSATSYTESVAYTRPPRSLRWRVRGRFSWGSGPWSDWCEYNLIQ